MSYPENAGYFTPKNTRSENTFMPNTGPQVLLGPTPKRWPQFLSEPLTEPEQVPTEPNKLIRHILKANWKILAGSTALAAIHFVAMAWLPRTAGHMLDSGLENGITVALLPDALTMVGLILITAICSVQEVVAISLWLRGTWLPMRRILRAVLDRRTDVGKDMPSGDVVAVVTTDGEKLGQLLAFLPEAIGSAIAFVVVAALMIEVSVPLGLFVAIGMPIVLALITWIIKPLKDRISHQREQQGKLTTLASDAVVGLRVLRGVGGEDVYNEKYREQSREVMEAGFKVAFHRAFLNSVQTAGPALFTAAVVGSGLYLTWQGKMTPGELFAFYGYTAFLAMPLSAISNAIQTGTRGWVGAKKMSKLLAARPLVSDDAVAPEPIRVDWDQTSLTDAASGVTISGQKLTALVSVNPAETTQIATRLTRVDDADTTYAGDTDLRSIPIQEVRENIVLSGAIAELFTGTLRSGIMGPEAADIPVRSMREQVADVHNPDGESRALFNEEAVEHPEDGALLEVLDTADAADVLSSVEHGLDGHIAERGRSLSGGQRQRVALARALRGEPPVVVLIEPTSAVDSHTEARIASRLSERRAGKTTVMVTSSPLVLDQCDEVIFVEDGKESARGEHRELLRDPRYFAVVHRDAAAKSKGDDGEEAK